MWLVLLGAEHVLVQTVQTAWHVKMRLSTESLQSHYRSALIAPQAVHACVIATECDDILPLVATSGDRTCSNLRETRVSLFIVLCIDDSCESVYCHIICCREEGLAPPTIINFCYCFYWWFIHYACERASMQATSTD